MNVGPAGQAGQPPPPTTGAPQADPPTPPSTNLRRELNRCMPAVVLTLLIIFIGFSLYAAVKGTFQGNDQELSQLYPFLSLLLLGLTFGVWFVSCFTSDVHEDNDDAEITRRQGFRFAYVFALTSLVVLIFPVTNPWQPDILGPISLIRGCVDAQRDNTVPASIRCGDDDVIGPPANGGKDEPRDEDANPSSKAAAVLVPSAPQATSGAVTAPTSDTRASDAKPPRSGGKLTKAEKIKAAAAAKAKAASDAKAKALAEEKAKADANAKAKAGHGGASDSASAAAAVSGSASAGFRRRYVWHHGYRYEPAYPWLIVIGGAYGIAADVVKPPNQQSEGKQPRPAQAGAVSDPAVAVASEPGGAPPASGSSHASAPPTTTGPASTASASVEASGAAASDATSSLPPSRKSYQIVDGGFVIPYYIVFLAFLGSSIGLTRRIPEYQKRSERLYTGTPDQPPLDNRTVRELVIFQIMQLITAPFIAMVAFYTVAPTSVASGIALGFISGFSSELILLQIRGVVEGLFPKASTKIAETSVATGVVRGLVFKTGNGPGPAAGPAPAPGAGPAPGAAGPAAAPAPAAGPASPPAEGAIQPSPSVKDNRVPVPHAQVVIKGQPGQPDLTDETNAKGEFAIKGVPIGQQIIRATVTSQNLSGLATVTVSPGTEVPVEIQLK